MTSTPVSGLSLQRWRNRPGQHDPARSTPARGENSGSEFNPSRPFVAKCHAGHCKACLKPVKRGQGVRYVDAGLMHGACLVEFGRSTQGVTGRMTT